MSPDVALTAALRDLVRQEVDRKVEEVLARVATTRRLLSRPEAAEYLGVTLSWLEKDRVVPSVKLGRLVRYDPAELDRWLREQGRG